MAGIGPDGRGYVERGGIKKRLRRVVPTQPPNPHKEEIHMQTDGSTPDAERNIKKGSRGAYT